MYVIMLHCNVQLKTKKNKFLFIKSVTELLRLGLESPSDPEIRMAAYRGLIICLPDRPELIDTLLAVFDINNDYYSRQGKIFCYLMLHYSLSFP